MLPVLKASVHDVRYFAALLRGVNFVNRATITVTKRGFIAVVEEARTLLGTAYIFSDVFDEYEYNSELPSSTQDSADDEDAENTAFEVPLNTLIECLNIFGTAGGANYNASGSGRYTRWKKVGDNDDGDDLQDDDDGGRGRMQQFFGGSSEKRTGMRMSYAGAGYPLTLLLAEDSTGPTTTCEISTYDAEPHLELPFDLEKMVLKIILKSEWLRDALSELDPSCEKLTFIGNPPPKEDPSQKQKAKSRIGLKPMLRIQATGTFGSTEMDYPNDRDVLETFDCAQTISFSYRFTHISRTLRALQSSTKTSLRIDDEGLLSLQFLMPSPSPKLGKRDETPAAFIEFRCLALDEE
ncbi:Rad1/Rec1/Rad17 [Armillaria luteobubalina]|uniref:Rad1/Rec1/Rad17 n=1 Tax=Armillaria luteobubalina TaxID=153913 RepID=A0AA39P5W3_9AGAR|nr:Rad1/Rec1/Rad17 [Armillaria luteobubalina]